MAAPGFPVLMRQVLIPLAAMHPGALATVPASGYSCDGRLAAGLLGCTCVEMPVVFWLSAFLFG